MADDWQAGDLALCVSGGEYVHTGHLYTVTGVIAALWVGGGDEVDTAIVLAEASNLENVSFRHPQGPFWHGWFRKVTPPEADEFDREVIDLMRPVKEPAA